MVTMRKQFLAGAINRRRLIGAGAATGAAALIAAACGESSTGTKTSGNAPATGATAAVGQATEQPKRGGTLVLPGVDTNEPFDPGTVAARAAPMWNLISDAPIGLNDKTYEVHPQIIEKWEQPSASQVVLKLRQGVTWHDIAPVNGRAVTAEDVATAIMYHAGKLKLAGYEKKTFHRSGNFTGMEKATATDNQTITLEMSSPSSAIFYGLADFRVRLFPKEQLDLGFTDSNKLIGCGPFMLKPGFANPKEYGSPYVATANPKYWDSKWPLFEKVDTKFIVDPAAQNSALLAGNIDGLSLINRPAVDLKALVAQKRGLQLIDWEYGYHHWLMFNINKAPWNDKRVRQALSLAVDYKALGDGFYGDMWNYSGPMPAPYKQEAIPSSEIKTRPGWNPATKKDDIANAKKMLEAAGFPDGKGLNTKSIIFSRGPHFANATRIKGQFEQVFPAMTNELDVRDDSAAFFAQTAEGNYDFCFYGLLPVPDPTLYMIGSYESKGGRNYSKYSNPRVDQLLATALQDLNAESRKKTLKDVQNLLIDESPYVSFYAANLAAIFQPGVSGYTGPERPGPGTSSYQLEEYARYMSKSA